MALFVDNECVVADFHEKNEIPYGVSHSFGGELGIRTLGTFLYTAFRVLLGFWKLSEVIGR